MEQLVQNATKFIKEIFQNDFSGHDFFHSMRVYRTAINIAEAEHADMEVVALAALLHDVDDRKLSPMTAEKKENAARFMRSQNMSESEIRQVCQIIDEVSFKGTDSVRPSTPEGKCVQDADRLDALGAIGIARSANKARKEPLRVILNGLGKDAAQIISRINGFTYVQTQFDYYTGELKIVKEYKYSDGERAAVRCFGADDVREGVAIMHHEGVDVSITGNSTNPTRFQHPVAGTYKKECIEQGKKYFSVASGGGTGRTLHPDNMAAGPASYGMTDTMGRMHSDAQFAGSSSVPAHVEMMGFLGMGNNPMVGATVSVAVAVEEALKK